MNIYDMMIFFLSVSRLEEKECDNKKEYTKLHERYSELFKTHLDYMEKTKSILGAEKLEQIQQGIGTSRPRIAGSKCKISKKNCKNDFLFYFTSFLA